MPDRATSSNARMGKRRYIYMSVRRPIERKQGRFEVKRRPDFRNRHGGLPLVGKGAVGREATFAGQGGLS